MHLVLHHGYVIIMIIHLRAVSRSAVNNS